MSNEVDDLLDISDKSPAGPPLSPSAPVGAAAAPVSPGRQLSLLTFAGALVAFLLPFMSVSCQGRTFQTFTGRQLVTGTDVSSKDMFSGATKTEHIPANPLAVCALLSAVAGLAATFSVKSGSPLAGALAAASAVLLVVMKSRIEADTITRSQGMVQVQAELGFWAAVVLLVIAALSSFGLLKSLMSGAQSGGAGT